MLLSVGGQVRPGQPLHRLQMTMSFLLKYTMEDKTLEC